MARYKVFAITVIFLMLFCLPGCLGRMAVSSNVTKFNVYAGQNKWGREIMFVCFYIVPVYPTCAFVDLCIVNAVEFWTGENPISGESALVDSP